MYQEWIAKDEVVRLRSIYIKCLSCVVYVSRVDHQRRSCKVAEPLYEVFKVALSIYQEWITKGEVVKLRSHYIKFVKLRNL